MFSIFICPALILTGCKKHFYRNLTGNPLQLGSLTILSPYLLLREKKFKLMQKRSKWCTMTGIRLTSLKSHFCGLKFHFLIFAYFYPDSNSQNCGYPCLLALKHRVYLRLNISRTTNARTFKPWEYLNLEYKNSCLEFLFYSDIPRVGKRIKINVFNS